MAQSSNGDGRPGPGVAGTAAEFVDALRRLKSWSGMGLRRLERRAAALGLALPRSTIASVLSRDVLPREDLAAAMVRTCGGDQDEVDQWVAARRRIAAATPPAPPAAGSPVTGSTPEPVRHTLPTNQAVFIGRGKELERIAAAVTDAAQAGGVIAIHAIDGMPGIGKTTLAVHVAHQLTDRFGDRQLFIDLRAHTPGQTPLRPEEALAQLLCADGVDPRFLPGSLDGRASLWRDRMAGKRLLLILDNAAGSEQVAPLLPGSAGSLVLVTSRRSLADLPAAVPIGLDVLTPDEAMTMFLRLAARAVADRDGVAELVRLCGYLPLAISIMASLYVRHRSWTIEDLLQEIRRPAGSPLTLTAETRTVEAVFDASYQQLPADRQRLLRLISLHPGVDIEPYAAAALAGISLEEALGHLDGLHADHLIEEPGYRRYRMHDLIRAYTRTLAARASTGPAQREALGRLLDFYRYTTAKATEVAYPNEQRRPAIPTFGGPTPDLSDRIPADHWLDTELPNLLAAAQYAARHDLPEHSLQLSAVLHRHLFTRGHFDEAETLHHQALDHARRQGLRPTELDTLLDLGHICRIQGRYRQAADHFGRAVRIAQEIGNRTGELDALTGLGRVHRVQSRYPQAVQHYEQAIEVAHVVGDLDRELEALIAAGYAHRMQDHYQQAADRFARALRIAETIGDRIGELAALTGLGHAYRLQGRHPQAAVQFKRAIQVASTHTRLVPLP